MDLQAKLDELTTTIEGIDFLIKYEQEQLNALYERRSAALQKITQVIGDFNK